MLLRGSEAVRFRFAAAFSVVSPVVPYSYYRTYLEYGTRIRNVRKDFISSPTFFAETASGRLPPSEALGIGIFASSEAVGTYLIRYAQSGALLVLTRVRKNPAYFNSGWEPFHPVVAHSKVGTNFVMNNPFRC